MLSECMNVIYECTRSNIIRSPIGVASHAALMGTLWRVEGGVGSIVNRGKYLTTTGSGF